MSTAARSWWANATRKRRHRFIWLATLSLLWPLLSGAQSKNAVAAAHSQTGQQRAHALLAATIQALGGKAWLDLRTMRSQIRTAAFFQGAPTGTTSDVRDTAELPDKERLDIPKQHVVQIFSGDSGWEITYKGKRRLSQKELDRYLRLKHHSLGVILSHWYHNPATILVDEGPSEVERSATEKITLIDPGNDAVTLEIDVETHLPLRLSFAWRDPRFNDKNLDAVEYDNYQSVDGLATPFTVTWTHNGETIRQDYLGKIEYNIPLPKELFDPDQAAQHLK